MDPLAGCNRSGPLVPIQRPQTNHSKSAAAEGVCGGEAARRVCAACACFADEVDLRSPIDLEDTRCFTEYRQRVW